MTRAKRIALLTALTMIPVAALAAAAVAPESGIGEWVGTVMAMFDCSGGCPHS